MKNEFPYWSEMNKKNIKARLVIIIILVIVLPPLNPPMSSDNLLMAYESYGLETKDRINTPFTAVQDLPFVNNQEKIMGAYIPDTLHLEDMDGNDQTLAILDFLEQGFNEYYYVMDNFWDPEQVQSTER